ncbi:MAG: DNA polymerase I, partial [Deltaproteobacteria bacterium]|nr:DNA polymerase I [Deltaproteobacteria bacterium]
MSLRQRLNLGGEPVFLMDGSAYVFRGFYANQNMSRADGTPSNVLFMVLRLLLKILREESPAYFNFVLDGKGKNFRHRLYSEYKAHRLVTPEPLAAQIAPLCRAVRDLGLHLTVSEDCEADDCIASLASRFAKTNPVVIIGADKDLKQCLAPNVYIWDPSGKDEKLASLESFTGEWGFEPRYWPDYQAIVGDSSDNIPGVPGIGAKGAGTLLREFKGLEDIFERLAGVSPALRKKLEGNREKALLSRALTTLKLDTCRAVSLDDLKPAPPRQPEILDFMNAWELRSLSRELASMLRIKSAVQSWADVAAPELSLAGAFGRLPNSGQGAAAPSASGSAPARPIPVPALGPAPGPAESTGAGNAANYAAAGQNSLLDFSVRSSVEGVAVLADTEGAAALSGAGPLDKTAGLPPGADLALIFARDLSGDKNDPRLLLSDGATEVLLNPDDFPANACAELTERLAEKRLTAPEFKA